MQLSKLGLLTTLCALLFITACSKKDQNLAELDQKADVSFTEFISGYTQGIVSSREIVTVRLSEDLDSKAINTIDANSLLSFSPSIRGKAQWVTNRTLEFIPSEPLKADQKYVATLALSRLRSVDEEHANFQFGFQVMAQNYDLVIDGLVSDEDDPMRKQMIKGRLVTADFADSLKIIQALNFEQAGSDLDVQWQIDNTSGINHEFIVSGVERKEEKSGVSYQIDGPKFGAGRVRRGVVNVPALGSFRVLQTKVMKMVDPYVLVSFSDPIKSQQELTGLITIEGERNLRFDINDNQVKVYPARNVRGTKRLRVFAGIKNSLNYPMQDGFVGDVTFEQLKPAIRLVGKGTILPSTDGLIFPFEAVNLREVDVKIVRIFEKNIPQFLQTNRVNGDDQIRRVGRPVASKIIRLDESGVYDLGKWNRFTLDLSEVIEPEAGAIYQVILNFRKSYSLYACNDKDLPELELEAPEDNWSSYDFNSGYYGGYDDGYSYPYNYRWNDRDNPCTDSYFFRRSVKRNVLASNLGLIAKIGNDRTLTAFVTDLKTALPLSGVTVDVYDYQNQLLETVNSDSEGKVEIDLIRKPSLLVANRGVERGYLKLNDGSSLSLSNFNVSGVSIERGLKGFIYGERGVWRPGDDIYLNFILEDKNNNIPEDHPVVFELKDPSGNVKERIVRNGSLNGFYNFSTHTSPDAPTGNWLATVTVGGSQFSKRIKIETVKPNRLKIDLDFGADRIVSTNSTINGDLNVKWLSGAPARNLKAEFELFLNPVRTTFDNYPGYSFDDRAKSYNSSAETVFDGRVDESGFTKFNVVLNKQTNAPGKLMATFSGKVFEAGGDFSIDQFSIPFYPYDQFVGIRMPEGDRRGQLVTGKDHKVEVVTVDVDGNPVDRQNLRVEVYKLAWRWWWDRNRENLGSYIGRTYNRPIMTKTISTREGRGSVEVKIDDRSWGRYYVRVMDTQSGHSAGTIAYFDWPGWVNDKNRPGGASLLSFSTDKENYSVGQTMKLNIPSSKGARALVSIENGSKVISTHWLDTNEGQTEFEIEVTDEMVPNAYVNTTLVQPHAQTKNDLPIRLYGVVPISVENPDTRLSPEIIMADVLEPESEVQVQVKEANGKPMIYTLAVVDEGLLDITRFQTPNPWNTFYAREALGVKTWDLYDDVTGALNGEIQRFLALGGDGTGSKPEKAKANRFKPVVKFLGPFELKGGQTAAHSYHMPNYIGSVRTMVIAGHEGSYGNAEVTTPVRKPLMVLGTLPRVIGPGERVKLPVNVFVLDSKVKDVKVSVEGDDLLKVVRSNSENLTFNSLGDQIIDFELDIAPILGVGKVTIIAESGNERAAYDVEIDVRNPNPEQTDVISTAIQPGQSWDQSYTPVGMVGTNTVELELSVIPPINLGKRLNYLIRYPHGCIEQTTSSAFPQLFLAEIMDVSQNRKEIIEVNIRTAIDRISTFQTVDGGLAYWPGGSDENDWGTNYAGHFLVEAKNQGYSIPSGLMRKWKQYQSQKAKRWARGGQRYNDDLVQAYRLYTLALSGSPEVGAMNRLREDNRLSSRAKWRLAAAYALIGRSNVAKSLIEQEPTKATRESNYYYYGSVTRDDAMILETLGLLNMQTEGLELLRSIAERLSADQWMSTQTTAYALLSVIKFSGLDQTSKGLVADYKLNSLGSESLETATPVKLIDVPVRGVNPGKVEVTNRGEGVLFVRLINTGKPLAGNETASSNGLRVDVNYTDRNGNTLNPASLDQGVTFYAEVNVFNPGTRGIYRDLALTQIFPSGWEILNERLNEIPGRGKPGGFTYQDIRDDRVYTYFDIRPNERKTFRVALNASYSGRYYLPAVNVEAMYDNTINARIPGQWVTIKRAQ